MPAPIAAPAAPTAPSTPAAPKNGAHTEAGQPPAVDPKANAKGNNEPGAKPGETAAETRQRLKVKLRKLDGPGEEELELDETEVGRYVQKARVADRQRGEFDKRVQEWEAREKAVMEDPVAYFRERGVDLVEVGRQEAARAEQLAKLDPVQRELAEARSKLERYEAEKTQAAEKAEADAKAAEEREFVMSEQALYRSAIGASGRLAPLPPNATTAQKQAYIAEAGYLMRLYADVREMAEHAGVPLTAEQLAAAGEKLEFQRLTGLAKRVASSQPWRSKNMAALKELAEALSGGLDDAGLMEFFGPKTSTRLARAQLATLRKSPIPVVADPQPPPGEIQTARRPEQPKEESLMGMLDALQR